MIKETLIVTGISFDMSKGYQKHILFNNEMICSALSPVCPWAFVERFDEVEVEYDKASTKIDCTDLKLIKNITAEEKVLSIQSRHSV